LPQSKEKDSLTIRDLPPEERPRERLQRFGPSALSAQEIIAVILGRGIAGESVMYTAARLLKRFDDLTGLADASLEELSQVKGIGPAKASQIKAAFELSKRVQNAAGSSSKQPVRTPEEVMAVVRGELDGLKKEHFRVLCLDTRNFLIKDAGVSIGSLDASIVHPREVFKEAISACASSVIFVHNHPSGDPRPSDDDIRLTKRLAEVGELVGISVIDHVITGSEKFVSLKREGLF
jgi:DNA repair protein RadC